MNSSSFMFKFASPFCCEGILGTHIKSSHFSSPYFSHFFKLHSHIFTVLRATASCPTEPRSGWLNAIPPPPRDRTEPSELLRAAVAGDRCWRCLPSLWNLKRLKETAMMRTKGGVVVGMGEDTPSETHVKKERTHMPGMPAGDQRRAVRPLALCLQTQSSVVFGIPPNTSAKLHSATELVTSGI